MALQTINPTTTEAWKKLQEHFITVQTKHLKDLFSEHPERVEDMSIKWEDFFVDYSKNRITSTTKAHLIELANEVQLKDAMAKYFGGDVINQTEGREVLHTALRNPEGAEVIVNGINVMPEIFEVKLKIKNFSDQIIDGTLTGHSGKPFTDVVNIGIGGSDLGPAMVVDALSYYQNHLTPHFVSNVDGDHVNEVIKNLNPETTLFVIVSKTFTTQETLSNANTIREWFLSHAPQNAISQHFVAVSTNIEKVKAFGIDEQNIFPMWNWVGGRFSLWSAVGLSISLSVGYENYDALLLGAHKMDQHFRTEPFESNIPVITGLLSVWYNNFFNSESEAIIPYSQYLNQFATYLQQGIMESNGKGIDRNGDKIDYQTGTIIWGEPGTNSQHAFFQLIHQGTKLIPAEFIGFAKSLHGNQDHQDKLMSNFFAQTEALMNGKTEDTVISELKAQGHSQETIEKLTPFKVFDGNRPTTTILINKLTPESLGKLIAMYEHRIFVQGIVWNIFSYDQFGVELGKQLANTILEELNAENVINNHDESTQSLIDHYNSLK
ncbi:glucose-6-phosphate isomerase [Psychroserpens sp.]|uniref:glucose-6-phosphate isomerase n=1 Tax=Psychroserpens sp. TaxID=2020870 RepID=UPI001AFFE05A|nr:glucose-6-phosphate isomerase [Psychroserpens sp.]MBO6605581.1 glucose-6-phosphate isomerase [Psychroserpens sp.]MBO6630040.1 glucose-6-phosphate isomerase [Psychroserpens sp.]MBO6653610.1 glucose-6-phosphate isomerase [Psychroserpens sp.]MBO6681931.1 glucose-6-phosphate isomerase [Psychroserpens sp.]MBO6748955.1 glucose-6-phosphate isomerase [Psychroserpens sp.]